MEELTSSKHISQSLNEGIPCADIIEFLPFEKFNNVWSKWEDCLSFSALRCNDLKSIEFLINNNRFFMTNSRGQNTFHYAVQNCTLTTIKFILLKFGTNHPLFKQNIQHLITKDKYHRTPLDLALYLKHWKIAILLCDYLKCTSSCTIRRSIAINYSPTWIKKIVENKLLTPQELALTFNKSINVLHRAIIEESVELITKLLEYGVPTNITTLSNISTSSLAQATRRIDIISIVNKHGSIYHVSKPLFQISRIQQRSFEK